MDKHQIYIVLVKYYEQALNSGLQSKDAVNFACDQVKDQVNSIVEFWKDCTLNSLAE